MERVFKRYYISCLICQRTKQHKMVRDIRSIVSSNRFEKVMVDFIGPLPTTKEGYKYIIISIDHFSKWIEAKAIKSCESNNVIEFYMDYKSRFGCPKLIFTDNGKSFIDKKIKMLVNKQCSILYRRLYYHPQSNGVVERVIRTIKQMISKLTIMYEEGWDKLLNKVLFSYRVSTHCTIRYSSYMILYGVEPRLPIEFIDIYRKEFDLNKAIKLIDNISENVRTNIILSASKMKKQHYKRVNNKETYKVGDNVL